MKKAIQIVLALVVVGLGYVLVNSIITPMNFQSTTKAREAVIVERLKDIRTAQRAYKQQNQRYTTSFDTLVNFLLNDSLVFEMAIGSADDSLAVAQGKVKREEFSIAAIDTVFGAKKLSREEIMDFENIPFANGAKFIMDAGALTTESKVVVQVFECKAPYKLFLADQDAQELINLLDTREVLGRYKGLKVGSMTEATNDAGNWE